MAWFSGITEKQRRFCEAFASNGGNAMAAARQAGYSRPKQEGYRQLEKAGITTALETLRQETTSEASATREERQAFWTSVMRCREEEIAARLKASELLGKSQADFIDRKEVTGANGDPLIPEREMDEDERLVRIAAILNQARERAEADN